MQGCKIWVSRSDVVKDSSYLKCDSVDRWAVLGPLDFRGEGIIILWNTSSHSHITVSHLRRHELWCQVTQNLMPGSPYAGWECNYVFELVLQFKEHVWKTYW